MIFSIGAGIVVLILVSISRFINWIKVLNAPETLRGEIDLLMQFLFVLFICQLLLKLVNAIINGDQKPALNGLISLLINFFTIIGIYGLFMVKTDSLISFGVVFLFVPVLVLLAISAIIFKTVYKNISPSIKYVDYKLSKDLLNLGIQFFIIQISGLVIFATQNLIITQLLGPAEVTVYNIAYRYFTLITMVFGVLIAPFWSAFTDAYVKHDIQWIQKAIRKITLLWGGLSVITVLMVVCSTVFYRFWVGGAIKIPFILSAAMGIFVIISNWNNIFAYFLNGASKIRLQLYVSIGTALVDIPLSIYLVKYMKMGTTGIIVTASGLLFISSVLGPIQYRKIITGTAKGIWNK
jgi:O-antigen/teichoic acid export membrane protein